MSNIMHLTHGDDPAAFSIIITKSKLIDNADYIITGKPNDNNKSIFTFAQTGRNKVVPNDESTKGVLWRCPNRVYDDESNHVYAS